MMEVVDCPGVSGITTTSPPFAFTSADSLPCSSCRSRRSGSESAMIEACALRKRYGRLLAVDGISFKVEPGEVLGPVDREHVDAFG